MSVTIAAFAPEDARAVLDLILSVQAEFGIAVTAADQPDLAEIPAFYQSGAGGFWVAKAAGKVVGSLGLKDIGGGRGALRKMFVAAPWRGDGTAQALLETALAAARGHGLAEVLLGTTEMFRAAHRFYEKNGFRAIAAAELPPGFLRMAVDTRFYALEF